MVFFLVYSIYTFRGKQPRNLTLNCCLFYVLYDILLWMCSKEGRRLFFFFMTYVLGHYRRSKYNYQKIFFYIWHIYFNRKLTSDYPIRHLWNRPLFVFSLASLYVFQLRDVLTETLVHEIDTLFLLVLSNDYQAVVCWYLVHRQIEA